MTNVSEILDVIISFTLFLYIIDIVRKNNSSIRTYWFLGILLILFSKFCSVIEAFVFFDHVNLMEHLSFFLGCVFVFVSILNKEL